MKQNQVVLIQDLVRLRRMNLFKGLFFDEATKLSVEVAGMLYNERLISRCLQPAHTQTLMSPMDLL